MKTKLKINHLEVQSFVTSMEKNEIYGGAKTMVCPTDACPTLPLNHCISSQCATNEAGTVC